MTRSSQHRQSANGVRSKQRKQQHEPASETPGKQLTAEETTEAGRAQGGNWHGVATGEQEKVHHGDTNNQGQHQQQIEKETHNQTDLELTAQLERAEVM